MSQYASMKKRTKDAKAPCPSTLIHNARLDKNIEYLLPKHLRLKNYHMTPISNATKTFNSWKRENEDRYKKIKNRKLRSDAHRLESLLIILSEEQVDKCKPDDIWERAHVFKEWFEIKYETKVKTMDWHRDEGHSDEDENDDHKLETRNNHIHLEFDNVNNQGKMVRRLFSKGDLKIFQDKIAEIYAPLGFIRGEDTAKSHRNDVPKRGLGQEAFRSKKKVESREKKIKKEMELLREELQKWEAKDSHYTQLAKTQEELQEKLLEQEINYSQAIQEIKDESQKIIDKLKFEAVEKNREIDDLQDKSNIIEESFDGLMKTKNIKIKELQGEIAIHEIVDKQRVAKIKTQHIEIDNHKKAIKDKTSQVEADLKILQENKEKIKELESASHKFEIQHKEKIESKDNEILSLNQQVEELKKDIFSEDWTEVDNNGNKHKSKNIDVVKHLGKKHTKLEEDMEALKAKNNTLTTCIEQKETQIVLDAETLNDSKEKIEVLKEQVEELKKQKPVIKEVEVIKKTPAKITFDDVKAYTIKYYGDSMTMDDMIKKKSEKIKELKSQNSSLTTALDKKDKQIVDLEEEKDELYDDMYCDETKSVLSICETYVDDVPMTWKERAEELKAEVNQLRKVIDGVKGFISKVFSAFGVGEDEPDGLEKINKRLETMESLKNPKKEKSQPIKPNTAPKMKF